MSNLTVQAPLEEPARQEYFYGDGQETGGTAERGTGTSADLLHQHLWLSDECQGF